MEHRIYGTLRANAGIQQSIKDFSVNLKEKGEIAVVMAEQNNILIYAWHDSKVVFGITNVHQPITLTAKRRQRGRALMFMEYNMWMGAMTTSIN